jgi:flagellar basal-body rod modification protein FlgD
MAVTSISNDDGRAALAAALGKGADVARSSASAVTEMSDRFLKLLVTQLKNQDPMNPMENAELTSQLAQMSTVEGITKLNDTMDGLTGMFRSSQVIQGAALVGRQVLAEGDVLTLGAAGAVGGVDLASGADSVRVKVLDAGGATLRVLDLGAQEAGLVRFVWDGKDAGGNPMAIGQYSFAVEAAAGGEKVTVTPYGLGSVQSVSLNDSGMEAEVSGLGVRAFAQIRQIY